MEATDHRLPGARYEEKQERWLVALHEMRRKMAEVTVAQEAPEMARMASTVSMAEMLDMRDRTDTLYRLGSRYGRYG